MSLEQYAYLGQLVAAAAVVASLLFLGMQIRASTLASRQTAAHTVLASQAEVIQIISSSTEASRIWRTGLQDASNLLPDERVRFFAQLRIWLLFWEEQYHLMQRGQLDKWLAHYLHSALPDIVRSPGGSQYLRERGHWLHPAFRAFVESVVAGHTSASLAERYSKWSAPSG